MRDNCILFCGKTDPHGYGYYMSKGSKVYVHREAYEKAHGVIPDGYEVHHDCETRDCINPDHLVALDKTTHRQLTKNQHARKLCCIRGHVFNSDNTRIREKNGRVWRTCIQCVNIRSLKRAS